jgi:hypothetical protein
VIRINLIYSHLKACHGHQFRLLLVMPYHEYRISRACPEFQVLQEFSRVSDGRLQGFIVSRVQKDNVANQREHMTLMLANVHIRLLPRPEPMHKV